MTFLFHNRRAKITTRWRILLIGVMTLIDAVISVATTLAFNQNTLTISVSTIFGPSMV
jgi:hypothetical protein